MDPLRLLVAEDQEQFRSTVVTLLGSEFQVVGEVGDGKQLVQAVTALRPDVIVSDIEMPLMDGLSARKELLSQGIEKPFVFMTMYRERLISMTEGIVVGYVHKTDLVNELVRAVRSVALGHSYLSRSFRENPDAE
jgi:DNA-binding NarL/FixJ family response regulator